MADIDYVARAPDGKCVEDLVQKEVIRALRRKVPVEQIIEKYGIQEREFEEGACRVERSSKRKIRAPEIAPRIAEKKLHKRVKVHRVSPKPDLYGEEPSEEEKKDVEPERAFEKVPEKVSSITPLTAEKVKARPVTAKSQILARAVPVATRVPREKFSEKVSAAVKVPGGEAVRVSPAPVKVFPISPEAVRFGPHVEALKGTLTARILDSQDKVIEEIAVRDLASRLKTYKDNIQSVVFDGVITQRLVDIASSNAIKNLIGVKIGNIAKIPADMEVLTASML